MYAWALSLVPHCAVTLQPWAVHGGHVMVQHGCVSGQNLVFFLRFTMHHGHGNPYCESCAGPLCLLPRCSQGSAIHLAALHTHTKQSGELLCSAWCLCVELLTALLYCMPTCRHAADVMASRRLQVCCSVRQQSAAKSIVCGEGL